MLIVIDIPKEKYDVIKSDLYNTFSAEMKEWGLEAIRKARKNMTEFEKQLNRIADALEEINYIQVSEAMYRLGKISMEEYYADIVRRHDFTKDVRRETKKGEEK